MRSSGSKSLSVSEDELNAALAGEGRRGVRRRLVAISRILAGQSIRQAARAAKATRGTVDRWLRQVRRSGLQSLLVDGRHGHAQQRMKPSEVVQTRRQIAAALARPLKPQVRARLIAIDILLFGQPIDVAAVAAGVLPDAVKSWLRAVTYHGFAAALAKWQSPGPPPPRQLDADPVALRELAAKERNPRIRKRMLALACVAEGMSTYDAEVKAGLNHEAITKRVRRFREEGIAAFYDREPCGRPKKLTASQLHELRSQIMEAPQMTYEQLRAWVQARFHVQYSREGFRRLLKKELGMTRRSQDSPAHRRRLPAPTP